MNFFLTPSIMAIAFIVTILVPPEVTLSEELNLERNMFAENILSQWCGEKENLVFSPYSLSATMAMVATGSRGATAEQLEAALQIGKREQMGEMFAMLNGQLEAAKKHGNVELALANSIWVQQDFALQQAFKNILTEKFLAEANLVDYVGQTEITRQTINNWVATKTAQRIKDLFAPNTLSAQTRLTLVNAVYFKAKWAFPFKPSLTEDTPFFSPVGEIAVKGMNLKKRFLYAGVGDLQVLEIPYRGNELSMLLILPKKELGLKYAVEALKQDGLLQWDKQMSLKEVILMLPKFSFTSSHDCIPALKQLGITDLFDGAKADLSGMAGKAGDLAVSVVVQKAFIEVSEEGTEAAAATGAAVALTAAMPVEQPVVFRADHPFVFAIRHRKTNTVLFLGSVVKPET